jgi:hypothetical protein
MRKVYALLFLIFVSFSQSCTNAPSNKENISSEDTTKSSSGKLNVNRISTSNVPSAVMSTFKAKYPTASGVEWETATEDSKPSYKAKWLENRVKRKAEFSVDGTFLKEK